MNQTISFLQTVLNYDPSQDILFAPGSLRTIEQDHDEVQFAVALQQKHPLPGLLYFDPDEETKKSIYFRLAFYGSDVLRLMVSCSPRRFEDDSPMLSWDPLLEKSPVSLLDEGDEWTAVDGKAASFSLK